MLDIVYGQALGAGTSWRHLLPQDGATAGFEAVGTGGLLGRLAVALGVALPLAESGPRTAAWLARVEARAPSARAFGRSFSVDPWGTAAHLLNLRDHLRMEGYAGGPLEGSARLADLSALDAPDEALPLPPGLPELARAVLEALEARDELPEPMRLRHVDARESLPALLARVLDRLEAMGATVAPLELAAEDRPPALAALLEAFEHPPADPAPLPPGAGVLVLDAETPWEAGELLAAWLADHPEPRRTLVAADCTSWLDTALQARGLPALGISDASPWRPALQVLPLRLSLGYAPRDPRFALELLTLPESPVPARLRARLLEALLESPGVGGPRWRDAVARATEGSEDPERTLEDVERWFGGPVHDPDQGMPASEAARLCHLVRDHARRRAHAQGDAPDETLLRAASVADELARAALALGPERPIPWIQLLQMHDAIAGLGTSRPGAVAEAHRPALCSDPAAVLPGAQEVVWWGFVGEAAGDTGTEPWTPKEARALAAAGVRVAGVGERRRAEARGWRRPFQCAASRVVLVRWRLAGATPTTPHPLSDELDARLGPGSLARVTLRAESLLAASPTAPLPAAAAGWRPATRTCKPASPPAPRPLWRLPPETLRPRPSLSPSAFEALFGCPLQWTLRYGAMLRPGAAAGLPDTRRVIGTFAHRLIQTLLLDPAAPSDPAEAARSVAADFDASVAGEAATLLSGGRDLERTRAREAIAQAARALVEALEQAGLRPVAAEQATSGVLAGQPWRGSADLVLQGPRGKALLDLKQGGATYRREALAGGQALQLALYAQGLAEPGGPLPPAGYFVVEGRRLLTVDGETFTGTEAVEGPSLGETLVMAERAFAFWRRVMGAGLVPARGLPDEDVAADCEAAAGEPAPTEGPGAVAAPCRFCDYHALCFTELGADEGTS